MQARRFPLSFGRQIHATARLLQASLDLIGGDTWNVSLPGAGAALYAMSAPCGAIRYGKGRYLSLAIPLESAIFQARFLDIQINKPLGDTLLQITIKQSQ